MHLGGNRRWVPLSLGQNHKTLNVFGMQPEYQQDVTKTGNGERGTGNGSLGTSCQRKPPQNPKWRSKKRERERRIQRKEFDRALVEIRWGRNCKSDSHFTFTF